MEEKHYSELLSGLIDGELSPEEANTVNRHLSRSTSYRKEYESLLADTSKLDGLSFREPQDEALQGFWRLPFSGFARYAGMILVITGYLLFLGYGFFEFITSDDEDFVVMFAVTGMVIGMLILFLIALIERFISYKTDPYKEIER
ncbi:MAG: zf-HC2 domain-containing protein [Pseudomonadales bacterium]|nr:zf-HC2 domain-containing protein [Pseudomonadales bacterium]